ncbi:UPF0175 family protein [Candidatus Woesearchaeota archaeon]|nr:UPF0175 family protein [Candidatus Woesearchaeota archaeon]HIH25780.1 hypothetical protein [Nanoarchaeota archaeon]
MVIKNKKLDCAIKKFINNKSTITKASQITDISLSSFMELLSQKNISFHYTIKDLEDDFEGLL